MNSEGQREKRIALIRKNPLGYLERALKALKTSHCEELVECFYDFERMGSGKAEHLLASREGTTNLLDEVPVGIWLKSLPVEDRRNLKLTLSTFGIHLSGKSVADVISQVEQKLQELQP